MSQTVVPEVDHQVLMALADETQPVEVQALALRLGQDQSKVTASCLALGQQGHVEVQELTLLELKLGSKGQALSGGPLPERAIVQALQRTGGSAEMQQLAELSGLKAKEVGQSLRWLKTKGWADKQGQQVTLLDGGRQAVDAAPGADEQLIAALAELGSATPEAIAGRVVDLTAGL